MLLSWNRCTSCLPFTVCTVHLYIFPLDFLCPTQLHVHQRMIFTAIRFILLKQIDIVRHGSRLHNDTYSVHKGALVLCRTCPPCLLPSCRHLTSSTVWCQLSIFLPAWRAGPLIFPLSQDGPAFPRVHAHLCPIVRYTSGLCFIVHCSFIVYIFILKPLFSHSVLQSLDSELLNSFV